MRSDSSCSSIGTLWSVAQLRRHIITLRAANGKFLAVDKQHKVGEKTLYTAGES
jgi:hypothetical protein